MVQAAGTTFAVTAAQLTQTTFTAGISGSDDLFVNVYDGTAFSGPKEFHVNVPANQAPTVTASNQTASSGQVLNASSLFTANDADGDSLLYFFYDNSAAPTSGHFEVNGQVQAGRHDLCRDAGATGEYDFRRRNHRRRPVRKRLGSGVLQRTEGVPHRHRLKQIPKPSRPLSAFGNSNTGLGITRDRCRAPDAVGTTTAEKGAAGAPSSRDGRAATICS